MSTFWQWPRKGDTFVGTSSLMPDPAKKDQRRYWPATNDEALMKKLSDDEKIKRRFPTARAREAADKAVDALPDSRCAGGAVKDTRVNGPVAALFRVKVEVLDAREAVDRPAVTGRHHATLGIVASDAEAAAVAGRDAAAKREGVAPERTRVVSVEFVDGVNVLATSSACTARGETGRSSADRLELPRSDGSPRTRRPVT